MLTSSASDDAAAAVLQSVTTKDLARETAPSRFDSRRRRRDAHTS
jgi:hypothetical protein